MISDKELVKMAFEARENAYVPYSNYGVGAALLAKSGKVYKGCNIENASYTPSVCGERSAYFKAVSEGEREFVKIAVCGAPIGTEFGKGNQPAPCGVCRQVMIEFCDTDFEVIMAKSLDEYETVTLGDLLPYAATSSSLGLL